MGESKMLGVIKQIDSNGRIVIPSDYRKMLGIELLENVEICLIKKNKNLITIEIRKEKND